MRRYRYQYHLLLLFVRSCRITDSWGSGIRRRHPTTRGTQRIAYSSSSVFHVFIHVLPRFHNIIISDYTVTYDSHVDHGCRNRQWPPTPSGWLRARPPLQPPPSPRTPLQPSPVSEKVKALADDICNLTVLEVADLHQVLKDRLRIEAGTCQRTPQPLPPRQS